MRRALRDGAAVVSFALVVAPTTIWATPLAPRVVRFAYSRAADAADCPDEEVVRAGVAARLGYDPFDDRAGPRVTAAVARHGRTLEARIEITGASGEVAAERKLTSRRSDCVELASAVELAISIAIDPPGGARAPPPAPPPPDAGPPARPSVVVIRQPSPPPVAPSTPGADVTPKAPFVVQARLGAISAIGTAPRMAFGGTAQLAVRHRALSLALEGRADLSASVRLTDGAVRTSLLTGSLVPCLHRGVLGGCALLSAGAMRASGDGLVDARQVTLSFVAAGARLALDVPLGSILSLDLHGDVIAPLTETVLRVSGQVVWTSASIGVGVGLGLGARFP